MRHVRFPPTGRVQGGCLKSEHSENSATTYARTPLLEEGIGITEKIFMLSIEQITPHLTWRLRRDVLYPGQYMHNMEMDEDNHGYHFGAFTDNTLVAVVSLFQNNTDWQFRKFAVSADVQKQGIGTQLLNYITAFVEGERGTKLWCNARLSATGFYTRNGFTQTGLQFHNNGFDYTVMQKNLP
jgi:predicted GNAT family N-acyltransferase